MSPKSKQQKEGKKIFVLDTNVLLDDPFAFKRMGEHDVVIPLIVICELDKIKDRHEGVSVNARQASVNLDAYFGPELYKNGVSLGDGKGKLSILNVKELHQEVKRSFKEDTPDNRIISAALKVQERVTKEAASSKKQRENIAATTVVLVSNDNNMRLKAGGFGLAAERYRNGSIADMDSIYSGVQHITLSNELIAELCMGTGRLPYSEVDKYLGDQAHEVYCNEYFVIHDETGDPSKSTYAYFHEGSLVRIEPKTKVYGNVSTRNDEQMLAMAGLLNPELNLITLSGSAGTGKTLLAIGSALRQLDKFDQILISKPIVSLSGDDPPALPGDAIEKVLPYMQSLYDNLNYLKSCCSKVEREKIEKAIKEKKIMIEPIDYIRGRSYPDKTCFIFDEAQNFRSHGIKTIITRMGPNSKIIFTGDIYQIDNQHLDASNNGFSVLIEKSKYLDTAAHVNLIKGERSALAEWGSRNL